MMKRSVLFSLVVVVAFAVAGRVHADLTAGLVAYYPLNGSAGDESGNGNHGTVNGAVLTTDRFGYPGSAYDFDGESAFIEVAESGGMDFGAGPFSLSVWISTDAVTTSGSGRDDVLAKGDPTIYGFAVSMQYNKPVFMVGGGLELLGSGEINDNQWHHVVGVREPDYSVTIYVDGQIGNTGWNNESVTVLGSNLIIGRHGTSTGESFFKGSLDDIRIYNRALSGDEVKSLYASYNVKGDVIADGDLNLRDVISSLQVSAGVPFSGNINVSGDVNGDGKIGVPEAIYAIQCLAGVYNEPPSLASIGDKEVAENSLLGFTISASDPEGDDLAYSASDLPQGATFDPGTREFSWTPSFAQSGVYYVTFVVSDLYRSNSETIAITVNDVPLLAASEYFPLSVGNWWDYKDDVTGAVSRTRVSGNKTISGTVTKAVQYPDGTKEYYTSDSNGVKLYGLYGKSEEYTGDIIFDSPLLLTPNEAPVGSTYSSTTHSYIEIFVPGYGKVGIDFDISSESSILGLEDVQTANKTLKDCIKVITEISVFNSQFGIGETGITYNWLYPGVGVVKQSENGDQSTISASYVNGVSKTY